MHVEESPWPPGEQNEIRILQLGVSVNPEPLCDFWKLNAKELLCNQWVLNLWAIQNWPAQLLKQLPL